MNTALDRFNARFTPVPESGCWLWTAGIAGWTGYGIFVYEGRQMGAHRASWLIHKGEIPKGMDVRHKCDTRSCVNPDHLLTGTRKENMRDMVERGRHFPKIEGRRVLTDEQILEVFNSKLSIIKTAAKYGVSKVTIRDIRTGRTWSHLTAKKYVRRGDMTGERHPGAKLSDQQVAEILSSTDSGKVLAERYGVSGPAISMIRTGKRRVRSGADPAL